LELKTIFGYVIDYNSYLVEICKGVFFTTKL
jgi:hypothetical protein